MMASPIGGGEPSLHVGHVAQPQRRAAAKGDDGAGQVLRRSRSAKHGARPAAGSACRRSRRPSTVAASPAAALHVVERHAVAPAAARDRPAPGTAGRAGPRWRRSPRPAPPSAAGESSTGPAPSGPSATAFSDQMPIFSTRLVDESGDSMTGGWATAGSRERFDRPGAPAPAAAPRIRSVPSSKQQHDRRQPEHRLRADRLQPRACRSARSPAARVTRLSTSSVERPGASVWISTSGGANSGNTSSGHVPQRADSRAPQQPPGQSRGPERAGGATSRRACASFADSKLGAEQFGCTVRDDLPTRF